MSATFGPNKYNSLLPQTFTPRLLEPKGKGKPPQSPATRSNSGNTAELAKRILGESGLDAMRY